MQTIDISNPSTTKWIFRDLEPVSKYQFYLRSCTTVGCGAIVGLECTTTLETSESWWGQTPWRYLVALPVGGSGNPGGSGEAQNGGMKPKFFNSELH